MPVYELDYHDDDKSDEGNLQLTGKLEMSAELYKLATKDLDDNMASSAGGYTHLVPDVVNRHARYELIVQMTQAWLCWPEDGKRELMQYLAAVARHEEIKAKKIGSVEELIAALPCAEYLHPTVRANLGIKWGPTHA
jgi:hypothetical protein